MRTIYDIAKEVGVSASTVSRVINQRPGVNAKTVERVRQAIAESQFKPRWKAAPAHSVGVVVYPHRDCLAYPFNAHLFSAISETLFAEGYTVQLIPRLQSDGPLGDIGTMLSTHQIQGVIVIPMHPLYGFSEKLEHTKVSIPHVVVGSEQLPSLEYRVGCDDYDAARQGARYLWQLGHRNFGVVTASIRDDAHRNRLNGFRDAIEALGGKADDIIVRNCEDAAIEIGESVSSEMMLTSQRPTAVVITNSYLAMGFSRGCSKMGVKVPDDVSLLGFEDAQELSMVNPPMTVMRQPTREQGELAVKLLLAQIYGSETKDMQRLLKHSLIVRQSTAHV